MRDQSERQRNGEHIHGGDAVITLLAYARMPDGKVTLSDDFLMAFYERARRDGIVQAVWGDKVQSPEQFVAFMRAAISDPPTILPILAFEGMEAVGLAWLADVGPVNAFAHFVMLKSTWGRTSQQIAREILAHWFSWQHPDGRPLLRVIIGSTPADNVPAIGFIRRLGFTIVGEIPHLIDGERAAVISYLSGDDFKADEHVEPTRLVS